MKVTIDGQVYEYDGRKGPVHEALWIEDVYKKNYGQWQVDLGQGAARAFIMLACLIWRREGRNVETAYQDVLDGKIEFDINEMARTLGESAEAEAQAEADPTIPGESPDPAGSPTTGTGTSGSSPSGSGSARGKSGSSKSRTSKP